MNLNTSLSELNERIRATLDAVARSRDIGRNEGVQDTTLEATLDAVHAQLETLGESICEQVAAHAGTYEMIRYLNRALETEYANVAEYERYGSVVEEAYLAGKLKDFAQEERRHANALSQKIGDLGGEPRFEMAHEIRDDMTAFDLLSSRRDNELEVIKFYDLGLEKFDDAEFRWLIGKIKVDEDEHLRALDELLERYRDTALIVKESKDFTWSDPYMGEPGERAWIE